MGINKDFINEDAENELHLYLFYKDKYVRKKGGRKFKSGLKENQVKDIIYSPYKIGKAAFTFYNDDSVVECRACKIVWKIIYFL